MLEFPATVSCYCGAIEYPLTLYVEANPTTCDLCHCDSCRAWSGGLFTAAIRASPPPAELLASPALTGYSTSEGTTRYFCTACGSHMQAKHVSEGKEWWVVNVGVVKDWGDLKVEVGGHWFVGDTKDGGGAEFWVHGTRSAGEHTESKELPLGWRASTSENTSKEPSPDDRLPAHCHCDGVSFFVTRPNEASKSAMPAGWPGLLGPYPLSGTHDPTKEHWWLRPLGAEKRTRYPAAFCGCDTCTRGLGFWGAPWAYVPAVNLVNASGEPVDLNNLGTLKSAHRAGSEGVHRDFCSRCGATVFWWKEQRGPLIDVAPGLLKGEGARAENWLEWHTWGVVREGDGKPENVYKELTEGLRAYEKRLKAANLDVK